MRYPRATGAHTSAADRDRSLGGGGPADGANNGCGSRHPALSGGFLLGVYEEDSCFFDMKVQFLSDVAGFGHRELARPLDLHPRLSADSREPPPSAAGGEAENI
jgi:hypothetical protein